MINADPLFIGIAGLTIASPGPAVVMTISNAMRYGLCACFPAIIGYIAGATLIAIVSSLSIDTMQTNSTSVFPVLRSVCALYLVYLAARLWRLPVQRNNPDKKKSTVLSSLFYDGFLLQLINPYVIIFFLSVTPVFIHARLDYSVQFKELILTYGILTFLIHSLYAVIASRVFHLINLPKLQVYFNKIASTLLFAFAVTISAPMI
ncbi:MAG: LysE family translocator [Acidiferrobacterales bacterium]|nr:LysE family translocator [Acidiferrobacterales bacterium]